MGIVSRMQKGIKNLSLTDPRAWDRSLWNLIGAQALSGENVTEQTALTYSAVWNAISLIAGTIGALPLHLMQSKGDKKRIADDHKAFRVMHDQWNPYMTAMAGRETFMAHVLTWGNGYAEIVRDVYGDLRELWPITPDRVIPEMQDGALVYRVHMPAAPDLILPREKILHVPGLGFDGFIGYSVVGMARKSIGLGMAMETFGSLYFGNGTHPSAIVTHPGQVKDSKAFRQAVTEVYAGLGNSHQLMLLEDGMTFTKVGIPPEDSQFLESRQFQIPEIARWFNLPPHKLKDLTKSSFSNIESEQRSYYADTLLPWFIRLEQNYNAQLLSKSDKELSGYGRLYFKHNADGILRPDTAGRSEFYSKMFNIGVFSLNEIRSLEDMDPITNGDEHFIPLNMVPLSMAKEQFKKKMEPPQKPTPEPEPEPAKEAKNE